MQSFLKELFITFYDFEVNWKADLSAHIKQQNGWSLWSSKINKNHKILAQTAFT